MVDMLTQRLAGAFDPLQLDRSLAMQAQTYIVSPPPRPSLMPLSFIRSLARVSSPV